MHTDRRMLARTPGAREGDAGTAGDMGAEDVPLRALELECQLPACHTHTPRPHTQAHPKEKTSWGVSDKHH